MEKKHTYVQGGIKVYMCEREERKKEAEWFVKQRVRLDKRETG